MRQKNCGHSRRKSQEWQEPDSAGTLFFPTQEEKDEKSGVPQQESNKAGHEETHPVNIEDHVTNTTQNRSSYQTPSLPAVKSLSHEKGECQTHGGYRLEDEPAGKRLHEAEDKQKQGRRCHVDNLEWSRGKITFLIHQSLSFSIPRIAEDNV